jgi:glycosyltransferase involved in cell wall biosynthesis
MSDLRPDFGELGGELQVDPNVTGSVASIPAPPKLSILMCAYNERQTIGQAVRAILETEYPCAIELILVDDGSTDGTADQVAQVTDPRLVFCRHPRNAGKGAALLSAVLLASGTHVLPFDADLEYEPDDIPRLLEPVLRGRAEVVYGTRLFGINTVYQTWRYAVGNRLLTRAANLLFNAYLSDLHTCLKLVPLATFRGLGLTETGFGLDTELTARLLRAGVRPFEVPVSYYSRSHAEGKKINWRDAVACLRILLRVRLDRGPGPAAAPVPQARRPRFGSGWFAARLDEPDLASVTALVPGGSRDDAPARATS